MPLPHCLSPSPSLSISRANSSPRSRAPPAACLTGDGVAGDAGHAGGVGDEGVQLHGGVGMTMEYRIGHYFKRLAMIDTAFGDADHHLARLATAGGLAA